ncbi:MAG: hypothetical protein HOA71_04030 [Nitrospina sp.]|jgi:hypothetical protein|nr:hypothetical protein [Nitrospina sp.]
MWVVNVKRQDAICAPGDGRTFKEAEDVEFIGCLIQRTIAICHPRERVVPKRRLELPHPFGHMNLNHARLVIRLLSQP